MDNLTHSLAGAALGRAGLYRRTRYAAGALIIGANLPDIDVIGLAFGQNLAFRRGITHGPIAMLVLPFVLTGLLLLVARWRRDRASSTQDTRAVVPRQLLLLSYIGVLSHPALDWLNSYGVRLLYPFSDRWFYGDSIFIIDPWIWIALGAGVWLARRRAASLSTRAARPARTALSLVGTYIALMYAGSVYARAVVHDHIVAEVGVAPASVMAAPVPANPVVRSIVVDMNGEYRFGRMTLLPLSAPTFSERVARNADDPAAGAAVATGAFDAFLYWSRFPYFTIEQRADSTTVRVGDARFPGFGGISNSFSLSAVVATPR